MRRISREQTLLVASMLFAALSFMVMAPACRGADDPGAKKGDAAAPEIPWGKELNGIQVRIRECTEKDRKEGKVMMIFEVRNTSDKPVEFCWWHSPLENIALSHRFKVTGPDGGEVHCEQIALDRSAPSREKGSLVTLRPGWNLAVTFDLLKAYTLKAGSAYSITFEGNVIGPLPASNTILIVPGGKSIFTPATQGVGVLKGDAIVKGGGGEPDRDPRTILEEQLRIKEELELMADARVLAVRPERDLVMISIGSSHGAKPGYRMTINRGAQFLAEAEIQKVYPDMCSARLFLKKGDVQVNDRATLRVPRTGGGTNPEF
jgi:hypothetical protein